MDKKITTKKPMLKETVGAQYYCFNKPAEGEKFDSASYEEEVIKTETVKSIETTENAESTTVRASGKDYETVNDTSSVDIVSEVVAFDPHDLAIMRGDKIDTSGLMTSGAANARPYFAYGKVVKKVGGGIRYDWYPKCQLVENTDAVETKDENFAEQNDTVTIRAYPFNENGDIKNYVDSEEKSFPKGLTEEQFFSAPIIKPADLTKLTVKGA